MKKLNRTWRVSAYLFVCLSNFVWAVDLGFSSNMPEETKVLTFTIPENWHDSLPEKMRKKCDNQACKVAKGYSGEFIAEKFFHYIFRQECNLITHKLGNTKTHGFDELYTWKEGVGSKIYYLVNESKTANGGFKLTKDSAQQSLFWNYKTISEKYKDYPYMQYIKGNFVEKLSQGNVVRTATYVYYNEKKEQYLMDLYWLHTGSTSSIYEQECAAFKLVISDLISKIADKKIYEIHLSEYMKQKFGIV
jgi:hypothetical protein